MCCSRGALSTGAGTRLPPLDVGTRELIYRSYYFEKSAPLHRGCRVNLVDQKCFVVVGTLTSLALLPGSERPPFSDATLITRARQSTNMESIAAGTAARGSVAAKAYKILVGIQGHASEKSGNVVPFSLPGVHYCLLARYFFVDLGTNSF